MKTINIPDDLHQKLKILAIKDNKTVKELIFEILEREFDKSKDQKNIEKLIGKRKNIL